VKVEALSLGRLVGVVPILDVLRHDLGKYVCFETRFVGLDADLPALRQAVQADVLATRKTGDAVEPAWDLWARLRPDDLSDDPDVLAIDQAVEQLAVADLAGGRDTLLAAAQTARTVQTATRSLARRAHQAALALGLDPDGL